MISAIIKRDMTLAFRSGGAWLYGLIFFAVFIALCAIALGGSLNVMRPFAPALIWLAVIFSAMLSFPAIFRSDYDDGTLAQFKLSGISLLSLCTAKAISFTLLSILPLIIATPISALFFDLEPIAVTAIVIALLLAAPALSCYGTAAAAILAGRQSGGFLVVLMTMPFIVPLLIFGVGAVPSYEAQGFKALELRVLIGLSLIGISVGLPAAAAALKAQLE